MVDNNVESLLKDIFNHTRKYAKFIHEKNKMQQEVVSPRENKTFYRGNPPSDQLKLR
jgi:hypothetical protein